MKDIAIYGAGGLGREVAAFLRGLNSHDPRWNIIGFFDDGVAAGTKVSEYGEVLGNRDMLNSWPTPLSVAICVGRPSTIKKVVESITNPLVDYPNLISDDYDVQEKETFCIGKGNIIKAHCTCTCNVHIGDFNLFNGSVVLGHDVSIGDYNVFMAGVRISGEVSIGEGNLFGSMSFVKQCLKIGDGVILSPLSPLLTNPKDGNTYMGNPARILKF